MQDSFYRQFGSARSVTKQYGTSYYLATLFLKPVVRDATFALYRWVRIPDEIVDNAEEKGIENAEEKLADYEAQWATAYANHTNDSENMRTVAKIFRDYDIPYEYSAMFLAAMRTDLTKSRYQDYDELTEYMKGSAAAVGLMMCHILGHDEGALPYAKQLGNAMQMTNFLRDIAEDIDQRDRIYLPQDIMQRFGVSDRDIITHNADKVRPLIKHLTKFSHDLYEQSLPGIFMLHQGRFAVAYAAFMYREILYKLAQVEHDPFPGRVFSTKRDKLRLVCTTLLFLAKGPSQFEKRQ